MDQNEFKLAYNVDARNFHVLRELAHVLCGQSRYVEAERYARAAYSIAPTNPFIMDVLCEVIIGKESPDDISDNRELRKLLHELEALGTTQGMSFYNSRAASMFLKMGRHDESWSYVNKAVEHSPKQLGPRLARIRVGLKIGRLNHMDQDIAALQGGAEGLSNRFLADQSRIQHEVARNTTATSRGAHQ